MRKTIVELVDDLDGKPADRTLAFSFEGVAYEIDLSDKNAAKMARLFAPYIAAARRTSQGKKRTPAAKAPSSGRRTRRDRANVREWARANGHAVKDRGRIPEPVQDAYDLANAG